MEESLAPTELGSKKISTLLREYAVPGIIAQTAASLYNMVDSIFIGHIPGVGATAISGLAVTFPLMNLSIALGTLVGVGGMTMISVLLGQRNYGKARTVLSNVLSLNIIIGVLFSVAALLWLDPILYFFGASEATLPYARDYMVIILLGNVFSHLYHGFNGIIRAAGDPKVAMGLTLFTVIFNAILDPIFIFVLGLGIKGAAIATILCQIIALVYTLIFLADKRRFLHFPRPLLQLDWKVAKQSLSIGMGPFLMNAAACFVAMFINQQLRHYGGDNAIGAYGIVNRFTMLFVMINMGFNQGLQPIAGYNYGARQYKRVKEVFILTAKWEMLVTTICFLISMFFPRTSVSLFTNDKEMIDLAARQLRVMNSGFALVGFGMASANFFQCLGMVKKSIFLSLSRQLIFLLPVLYALPLIYDATGFRAPIVGVWISFPISDALNIVVSAIMIYNIFKKFNRLEEGGSADILESSI